MAEEMQQLERDLVGSIAVIDHQVADKAILESGGFQTQQLPSTPIYSRTAALGFPGASVPQVNFADGSYWMLQGALTYHPGNSELAITVPAGFVHDFASVPAPVTGLIPMYGPYNRAAIIHDFLYWGQPCKRLQADNLLLIAMIEAGVNPLRRWAIYRGVRLGGWSPWSSNAEERSRHLPRVVPQARWTFPGDTTWARFRKQLFDDGVRDDVSVSDARFCRLGDSKKVPKELLAEAAQSDYEEAGAH